jgi:uncharacterized protein YjbI with pentapeptide repeats
MEKPVNLSRAKVTESNAADFEAVIKAHENYVLRQVGGQRASLRFAKASGINFSRRRLDEIDFVGADLSGADLEKSNLNNASLFCTNLVNANLAGAILTRADLRGADLKGACLNYAQMEYADFRQATLAFMDKKKGWTVLGRGQDLNTVSFKNCSLKGAKLNNANLKDANFDGALLNGASFKGATLGNASFEGAVLTGVEMSELCVSKDRLKNCILDPGAELRARLPHFIAILDSAQRWVDTRGSQGTLGSLEGEDVRLLAHLMKHRKLTKFNFARTVALDVDFLGCELQAANFDGADLRSASFVGADLRGASFRGANLAHANFNQANLLSFKLMNGTAIPTTFDGAILDRSNFDNAQLMARY